VPLPPGTILQHLYLQERLRGTLPGTFVEVGIGHGLLSKILLRNGWRGVGYDLGPEAVRIAANVNRAAVDQGHYEVRQSDWLSAKDHSPADLIVSSMVLEHLSDKDEQLYLKRCHRLLNRNGKIALFVPGSPRHSGIEDEVAGHFRRYSREELRAKLLDNGFSEPHVAGLTYPLSNWLRPISNRLVEMSESHAVRLSMRDRTVLSGNRQVLFKTNFPSIMQIVLNQVTLYPFHLLQKRFLDESDALVIYAEACLPGQ
jgi:SAM-dependent methyltransferase